jgi:hypothetical protein
VALVEKEVAALNPQDDVALFTFSDRLQTHVPFEVDGASATATKPDLVRQVVHSLKPTWSATDLGAALVAVASELDAATDVGQSVAEPQMVLISDFQKGSATDALQAFEWPDKVRVLIRQATIKQPTNAFAHLLTSDEDAPDAAPRVRVVNSAGSTGDQFFVAWNDAAARRGSSEADQAAPAAVYVPPGQSRVVKLLRSAAALTADQITLRGDDHEFDNAYFVVPPRKQSVRLAYLGTDADDDARGMQFYLRLAVAGDPLRQVEVTPLAADDTLGEPPPQLAVVTRAVSSTLAAELKQFVERGGTVLLVPENQEAAAAIPALVEGVTLAPSADEVATNAAAGSDDYLLLGEIDFSHPLFVPFANPKYSDFTKIHFWRHFALTGTADDRRYVAKFDNGDPAIIEQPLGQGRVIALATNWRPDDSQLALSSKFVPLVGGVLDLAMGAATTLPSVAVNEPVAVPAAEMAAAIVHKPGGEQVKLPPGTKQFTATDEPGVYRMQAGAEEVQFAVNLSPAESDTAPLDLEQLEQLGVRFGADLTSAEKLARMRQERDTELESRQKVWRWLIVAVFGALIVETWWAGRAAREAAKPTESMT